MMLVLQLAAAAALAVPAPGVPSTSRTDTVSSCRAMTTEGCRSETDTIPRRRPRAVEVSDAYELRLRIHRYASYTMIPLFAAQAISGNQMYVSGGPDPSWAKTTHNLSAGGLAALFTVNTVTGVWNLWESRDQSEGRTAKLVHSAFMLASDAGFTYAGVKLGPDAKRSAERRSQHRRVAYISMGSALAGYATMLIANR